LLHNSHIEVEVEVEVEVENNNSRLSTFAAK
jgi:hypothetical protein